ncbi:hypothetical protein [Magnetospirillum sp. UT-4]|uniref:hypothetical protein n=1 Tax=Magnetospirillum sp. UT-4 TaxID=2681467 RepID=UPI00157283FB|nr:hypothetical protein [Magnetospirillum sp. UT-4]
MTDTPHSLIERLMAEESRADEGRIRLVAELSARVGGDGRPSEATPKMMAARLDGHSDKERQGEADAVFAASPEALHDLASVAAYLEAVDAERTAAPADLVNAAIGSAQPRQAAMPTSRGSWLRWQLVGAGIGLALAALAAVLIMGRQAGPVDPKAPLIAKPEAPAEPPKVAQPKAKEPPAMVPAGSEDVVPTRKQLPKPAGAEEAAPAARQGAPTLSPESPDVMPGR